MVCAQTIYSFVVHTEENQNEFASKILISCKGMKSRLLEGSRDTKLLKKADKAFFCAIPLIENLVQFLKTFQQELR